MKKKIISLIQIVLVLAIAYALFKTYAYYRDNKAYNALEQDYKNKRVEYASRIHTTDESKPGLERGQNNDDLIDSEEKESQKPEDSAIQASLEFVNNLKKSYPQVQARLIIESLDMDYPIVQGQDNSFYLDHDYKGEYHPFGAVFTDARNSADFDNQNTILYGHNVKSGLVFHSLNNYRDKDFVSKNPYIIVDTTSQRLTYRIFAVYVVDAYDDYRSISYSDQEFEDLLTLIKNNNLVEGQLPSIEDRILTLSTCSNFEVMDDRLVVHAVLIN